MAHQRGISGDEIRREQEESRRRSRGSADARPLQPSVSMIVTWVEIDWLMPLAACAVRGVGKIGLALAALAIGLEFFSSTFVTIQRGDEGVQAILKKPWRSGDSACCLALDTASLRYWNAWLCRGFELAGSNGSIAASGRRGSWFRPPLGVPATSVRPFSLSLKALSFAPASQVTPQISRVALGDLGGSLPLHSLARRALARTSDRTAELSHPHGKRG